MTGGLIIDKPEGWTSHDVVAHVRRLGLSPEEEQAVFAGNADRLVPPPGVIRGS